MSRHNHMGRSSQSPLAALQPNQHWCAGAGKLVEPMRRATGYSGRVKILHIDKRIYLRIAGQPRMIIDRQERRPRHTRCPLCGRRLVPRTMNTEPWGPFEPRFLIPPHKIRKTKRKKP